MLKVNSPENEELDRVGKLLLQAAIASEADTAAAASSPFVFTRVRAAIQRERREREESGGFLSLIRVAWRAVPAMAMIAIMAAGLTVWTTRSPVAPVAQAQADDEYLISPLEPGVEQEVLTSRNGLSREEIFNIVVDRNYEANSK